MAKRKASRKSKSNAAGNVDRFRVHILDVGRQMYGDAIVVEVAGRRIFVDGGHRGNIDAKDGHLSFPQQLESIFGKKAPFRFDLLVVTHCHADHIGCLPEMVNNGTLVFEAALVADPALGWGLNGQDSLPQPQNHRQALALALLREEDSTGLDAADSFEHATDLLKLQDDYRNMLARLEQDGTRVVRYRDLSDAASIEAMFPSGVFRVHGPSKEHLELCARQITRLGRDALDALDKISPSPDAANAVFSPGLDGAGIGAAINNQSIVFSIEHSNRRTLLLGDMQLAKSEVVQLDGMMKDLVDRCHTGIPPDVVKTPHHSSYNGLSESVIAGFANTKVWVHSGGSDDGGHPDRSVLKLLSKLHATDEIAFARTDRNGLISIDLSKEFVAIKLTRGKLNDFVANPIRPTPRRDLGTTVKSGVTVPSEARFPRPTNESQDVQINVRVPRGIRVRINLDIDMHAASGAAAVSHNGTGPSDFAGGRKLPALFVITDAARLTQAVGPGAEQCLAAISAAGHRVIDIKRLSDPKAAAELVRSETAGGFASGVLILGGPLVVPPFIVDVLPEALRREMESSADPDEFYVWSDDPYGDRDGDGMTELPVSRLPDCGSFELLMKMMSPKAGHRSGGAGIRNFHRKFADEIFSKYLGPSPMSTSESVTAESLGDQGVNGQAIYLMLHGSDSDGARYWGETRQKDGLLAMRPENIGEVQGSAVFAGCCWGGLAWSPIARRARDGNIVTPRTPTSSMALQFLARGALAFIGSTGAHYSPLSPPYDGASGPMHHGFWRHFTEGRSPADALFLAKRDYASWMSTLDDSVDPPDLAISYKTLKQFVCLGLGW